VSHENPHRATKIFTQRDDPHKSFTEDKNLAWRQSDVGVSRMREPGVAGSRIATPASDTGPARRDIGDLGMGGGTPPVRPALKRRAAGGSLKPEASPGRWDGRQAQL